MKSVILFLSVFVIFLLVMYNIRECFETPSLEKYKCMLVFKP